MGKILLVDDEAHTLQLVKIILESEGHEVHAFSNPCDALTAGQTIPYDLYILDVMMPKLDGYSLARSFSTKFPDRKILLLTCREYEKDKIIFNRCGASSHMMKPFDQSDLLLRVQELLDNRKISYN